MKSIFRFIVLIAFTTLLLPVSAAPPQTINYQGYLTSPAGAPVNATVAMTFRLYGAASGGGALWTEAQPSVGVSNGSFNVVLGSLSPIPLPFDAPYWFSVAVNGDAEMSPRQPLAGSPYAFRAAVADTVSPVATITGSQVTGAITSATIAGSQVSGSITSATLPGAQVTGSITNATIPAANVTGGSNGTVTSVATGQGLTGGPIFSSGTVSLDASQLLPTTTCGNNQIPKWIGAWQCANDDSVPGGGVFGQILASQLGLPQWTTSPTLSGTLTVQGAIELSGPAAISKNGVRLIAASGGSNFFAGLAAGTPGGGAGNNTAIGEGALSNVSGGSNTAVGRGAGSGTNSGNNNTFIGVNAGNGVGATSGNNIVIGNNAGTVANAGTDSSIYIGNAGNVTDFRAIRIGTVGTQLKAVIAGISGFSTSQPGGAVFIDALGVMGTTNSSRRFKEDIVDMGDTSSALMKLRPVTFHYKAGESGDRTLQYGLIAEEVNDVYPGLVLYAADGQIQSVAYQHLPPMLLNEFQKQQRTLQVQAARLEVLERELREIKSLLGAR
ncbi:MAG: tail fiber domain-containing protein [Betaproteobacteria bacterium]